MNQMWMPTHDSLFLSRINDQMDSIKIIIEKHTDGYVAYPLGLKGVVVGEGDTYEEALADVESAISFHVETFGVGALEDDSPDKIC
jgi:predicted RNase H-like HicB family nuclease